MTPPSPNNLELIIRRQAAEWVVRRDRGLSAHEAIEYELWLADDERHAAAIQRSRAAWSLLDHLADQPAPATLQRAARRSRFWPTTLWGGLAAAAAFTVALAPLGRSPATRPVSDSSALHGSAWVSPQIVTLSDGTQVRLNADSEVREQYTTAERRVELVRGEAHFTVIKAPSRPFIVHAGTVEARAVGTAFNVNLQPTAVEILVTEGTVAVSGGTSAFAAAGDSANPFPNDRSFDRPAPLSTPTLDAASGRTDFFLTARQRAVVALEPVAAEAAVVVAALSQDEVNRALAWQEPLLRLSGATLGHLIGEFERRTGDRLILADPHLAALRTGGRFRGDDVEGFLRILETNYGIESETLADGSIVLRHVAPSGNR